MQPHRPVEGYADDTYMVIFCLLLLRAMPVATGKLLRLTREEVNTKKLLAFSLTTAACRKPEALEATLDGV